MVKALKKPSFLFASTNKHKIADYVRYSKPFKGGCIPVRPNDDREPVADLEKIIAVKATLNEGCYVDDTTLYLKGVQRFGPFIKYFEHELDEYEGVEAVYKIAFAGVRLDGIRIYYGSLKGKIVKNRFPSAVGFNGNFYVDEFNKTLHQMKVSELADCSPRAEIMSKFYNKKPDRILPFSEGFWNGAWQNELRMVTKDEMYIEPV